MPIFDQGYQHWKGPLSGHAWRWLAVARHGVRAQLKGRLVRLLLLIAWAPAIALIAVLAVWGLLEQRVESVLTILNRMLPVAMVTEPQTYRAAVWSVAYGAFFKAELFCAVLLVMLVGPNLISRDLRFNAMPLYFSRPLRRFDYFIGKLGVIAFFLAATLLVPAVAAYVLGVAFSLDIGVVRDTYQVLLGSVLYSAVIILSIGTLMLALSALSRRTIYVGLAWIGLWIISGLVGSILVGLHSEMTRHDLARERMTVWLEKHPPPPGIQMYGIFPGYSVPSRPSKTGTGKVVQRREDKIREAWGQEWQQAFLESREEADAIVAGESRSDWRPLFSYPYNLTRMGDFLLDSDAAWVTFGRAIERPRAAFGPAVGMAGGRRNPAMERPFNERMLADQMVWQFPWYWSAGLLAGLALVSVGILTRQVKSLDRLK
jgi:ABC-type transport system involved in multi-copper enzyme maturation permease subunit